MAIKAIDKKLNDLEKIREEIAILEILCDHKFVIKLLEYFEDRNKIYLVFELAEKGDLVEIINSQKLSLENTKMILFQLLQAIKYAHSKNVIHRDLKLDNVLLNSKGEVKLIDFGISSRDCFLKDSRGTPNYISPETLQPDKVSSYKSDMWSFGVIAYILYYKQCPFYSKSKNRLYEKILLGEYSIPSHVESSNLFLHLLRNLLVVDAERRMGVQQAIDHPWFDSVRETFSQKYSPNRRQIALEHTIRKSIRLFYLQNFPNN